MARMLKSAAWLLAALLAIASPAAAQTDTTDVYPGAVVCGGWVVPDSAVGNVYRCDARGPNDARRVAAVVGYFRVRARPLPPPPPPPPVDTVTPPPPPDTVQTPAPPPAGWREVFRDDFETGNLTRATAGYRWGSSNGHVPPRTQESEKPRVVPGLARSGRYALQFRFEGNADLADDAWSEQRFVFGDTLKAVRLEWWIFLPPTFAIRNADGPDNNKFLRLWDEDYNAYRVKLGYSFQLGPQIIAERGLNGGGVGPSGLTAFRGAFPLGRWVPVAVEAVLNCGGLGSMTLWVDGKLASQNVNVPLTPAGAGCYLRNGYLLGWANSGFSATTYTYIDDFTVLVPAAPARE